MKEIGWESEDVKRDKSSGSLIPEKNKKDQKRERAELVRQRGQALKIIQKKMNAIEKQISVTETEIMENQEKLDLAYMDNDGGIIGKLAKSQHDLQTELTAMYEELETVMQNQEETEKDFNL